MTATQEISIVRTSESASNHEDWLSLMRVGMTALLSDPRLLSELIWGEASRQAERHQSQCLASRGTCDEVFKIFDELGLKTQVSF
ncbi:hypothetical protein IAD21_04895 [Abditibacteriota bacterium]|nr:hypothetical protein IAD21_04895 [Abditibacteriota bacterium]